MKNSCDWNSRSNVKFTAALMEPERWQEHSLGCTQTHEGGHLVHARRMQPSAVLPTKREHLVRLKHRMGFSTWCCVNSGDLETFASARLGSFHDTWPIILADEQ